MADRQVVRVEDRAGTVKYLGPETPFGARPLVERDRAEEMDPSSAGQAEWKFRRGQAWRGYQISTEDA